MKPDIIGVSNGNEGTLSPQTRNSENVAGRIDELDDVDVRILTELRADGRASIASIARAAGISRSSAYSRVEQLQERGTVLGFHAQVDAHHVGLSAATFVMVRVHHHLWGEFRTEVAKLPEVEYCSILTGEHDAMMLVRACTVQDIHVLVAGVISGLEAVNEVTTVVVLDEIVRRPFLLPSDLPDRSRVRKRLRLTAPVRD